MQAVFTVPVQEQIADHEPAHEHRHDANSCPDRVVGYLIHLLTWLIITIPELAELFNELIAINV